MVKKIVYIQLKRSKDAETHSYPVNATMLHGWAVHRTCSGWVNDAPKFEDNWWAISAPNGRALGWFETQGQALECIRRIYEFATVTQVAAVPSDKNQRTPEQQALAARVMAIVNSYLPEEGEL